MEYPVFVQSVSVLLNEQVFLMLRASALSH